MVKTYSETELVELWRLMEGYEPLRTDCEVIRTDGIDLDSMIKERIDVWYRRILATAPVDKLPLTDFAPQLAVSRTPDGVATASLPPTCIRVVEVMMDGWVTPGRLVHDSASADWYAQMSEYSRGGCVEPVVLVGRDSVTLYSPPSDVCRLVRFLGVPAPMKGVYSFDPSLLPFDVDINSD